MANNIIKELFDKSKESFDNNNFELSIKYLEKILFYQKDNYKIYYIIGTNKNHLKQYEEAITNLNKAIELNSTNCLLYSERALSKHSLGLYEEAIKGNRAGGENRFVFRAAARENAIQRPAWC